MTDTDDAYPADGLAMLREALAEAQATVRAYDTKAQIVGVGYIFALGVITRFETLVPKSDDVDILRVVLAWLIVVTPIVLFGIVLYPTRRTAPKVVDGKDVKHVLYVRAETYGTVASLRNAAASASYSDELAFEVLSVSKLRDLKRKRFLRALFAAGASFLILFASQAWRSAVAA